MTTSLYSLDILRLAASTASLHPLENPEGSAERRSPVCGSRVAIDVSLDDVGRVEALGAAIHACALGQASAAVMAAHAHGRTAEEFEQAGEALRAYLSGANADPGDWPGLEVFAAARAHPARHAAILLAFDAAAEAARAARS